MDRDLFSHDPQVRFLRRAFAGMEETQNKFLKDMNIAPFDSRLRRMRETALNLVTPQPLKGEELLRRTHCRVIPSLFPTLCNVSCMSSGFFSHPSNFSKTLMTSRP